MKKTGSFLFQTVAFLLWIATGIPCAAQTPQPMIVVGIDEAYVPYEYVSDGQATGFNVDLIRAVADEIGYDLEFVAGPWAEIRPMLTSGQVDVLAGMYWSTQRDEGIDFGAPHSSVTKAIFIRENSPISSIPDIKDTEIIVQRGDVLHDWALEQNVSSTIIPVANPSEALILLAAGEHDCLLLPRFQGEYLINELAIENVVALSDPLMTDSYGFAVAEENHELIIRLNEGLAIVQETGEYEEIYEKWFTQPLPWYNTDWIRYLFLSLAAILILLVIVVLMNQNLRKSVQQRTDELERQLTERKKVEKELRIYAADLEKSNRELGIFSYAASHDLQAPLRKILAFCTRIRETQESSMDSQGLDYLDRAERSAIRMQSMLENLLVYANIAPSNRLFEHVNLDKALSDALADLELDIEEARASIVAERLPSIEGDVELLSQVFTNLIGNSLKFARTGRNPEIRITSESTDLQVTITINDNGIGFDNAYAEQIFGLFQRIHGQAQYSGYGMGLAICRRIVDIHHGSIRAHSKQGNGATFIITLPRVQPHGVASYGLDDIK